MITIYKVTNPNNRIYIGQTKNFKRRKSEYRLLRCKCQCLMYNSLIKYGFDNHIFEEIDYVEEDKADETEIYYIKQYNSYFKYNNEGLNLTEGGNRPPNVMGKEHYRSKIIFQYSLNGELIEKWDCIRDACRRYNYNSTAICYSAKYNISSYNYIWSYTMTQFEKYEANKGGIQGKSILQFDLKGDFIKEYSSLSEAQKITGISRAAIRRSLNGKVFQRVRTPYIWKYKDNSVVANCNSPLT